jgi:hypothetical protein
MDSYEAVLDLVNLDDLGIQGSPLPPANARHNHPAVAQVAVAQVAVAQVTEANVPLPSPEMARKAG